MPISTPAQITVPFATSGLKNSIPSTSNNVTGNAGYDAGFPAINMTPIAAGGIPPFGQDFNGIFFELSAAVRYDQAGGLYPYSSPFSTAVGGYPKGALIAKATLDGLWLNTTVDNTTNPDTGGAGWVNPLSGRLLRTSVYTFVGGVQMVSVDGGTFTATGASTFTSLALAVKVIAEGVGGGGGSGATTATGGSQFAVTGGASGACYGLGVYPAPVSAIAVAVGLAGAAGAAPGGAGGNGGTTTLGALLSIGGGSGSAGSAAQTGNLVQGGAATAKTVTGANIYSANGGYGHYGISLTSFIGGVGGETVFGPGGSPGLANTAGTSSPGNPATSPGAGGGGSATAPSAAAQPGAKGADGILIIREYA